MGNEFSLQSQGSQAPLLGVLCCRYIYTEYCKLAWYGCSSFVFVLFSHDNV